MKAKGVVRHPYVNRLSCEFHSQFTEHFMYRDAVMYSRFRSEPEDWGQRMVAEGCAICLIPERSTILPGIVTRPVDGLDPVREVVLAPVSSSGTPLEMRQIARVTADCDWTTN